MLHPNGTAEPPLSNTPAQEPQAITSSLADHIAGANPVGRSPVVTQSDVPGSNAEGAATAAGPFATQEAAPGKMTVPTFSADISLSDTLRGSSPTWGSAAGEVPSRPMVNALLCYEPTTEELLQDANRMHLGKQPKQTSEGMTANLAAISLARLQEMSGAGLQQFTAEEEEDDTRSVVSWASSVLEQTDEAATAAIAAAESPTAAQDLGSPIHSTASEVSPKRTMSPSPSPTPSSPSPSTPASRRRRRTPGRVYRCETCSHSFANSSNLVRHVRIHTGEQPYKCTFCVKSFNNSSNRRKHETTCRQRDEAPHTVPQMGSVLHEQQHAPATVSNASFPYYPTSSGTAQTTVGQGQPPPYTSFLQQQHKLQQLQQQLQRLQQQRSRAIMMGNTNLFGPVQTLGMNDMALWPETMPGIMSSTYSTQQQQQQQQPLLPSLSSSTPTNLMAAPAHYQIAMLDRVAIGPRYQSINQALA